MVYVLRLCIWVDIHQEPMEFILENMGYGVHEPLRIDEEVSQSLVLESLASAEDQDR